MHNEISHRRAAIWAVIACVLWSTAFVTIKLGLVHMKPFSFAGIRFMISGLMLLPFWLGKVSKKEFNRRSLFIILKVALLQTAILYGLFYYAITMVSGAVTSILIGASPIISAIVAHYVCHDDKLNKAKVVCMLTAALGVVFVVLGTKPWAAGGLKEVWGICVLMFGSIISSLANIIVSKDKKNINPVFLNSLQIFLGGFMLFLLSIPLEGLPTLIGLPLGFYLTLGWLAFLSAAAFSIWFFLLQHDNIKVSELNFWKFLIPVFGASLSWIFLANESPNSLTLAGMCLVAYAVWKFNK